MISKKEINLFGIAIVFCIITLSACISVRRLYQVDGIIENKSAQGMAIYGNYAFLANKTGVCRIYDLRKGKIIDRFRLASSCKTNHCNCLDFGLEHPDGNDRFPVIYVSECSGKGRCFVEGIGNREPELIQTIRFRERVTDWFVDRERKKLYAMAHYMPTKKMTDSVSIYQFHLPSIHEGDVDLSDKVEEVFFVRIPYVLQGGTIRNHKLYLPVGVGNNSKKASHRKLLIVDLDKQILEGQIDLESLTGNEPEDVSFYRNRLLLFCGQRGGLYRIDL